ncbi:MAG TPA: MBL fold metallo-hydrolase [Candidatus Nitrosotalea sp.]|nr:MBL fold metallo-hydrolase [Candidatus Nitrosotalea sp.]
MTSNGIVSTHDGIQVNLDPKKGTENGITFVSHAHIDHLHRQNGGLVLTSKQTSEIARVRGYSIENYREEYENFSLIDAGHILGAKGLLFGDEVFYTGDISIRERAFMKGAKAPKCKVLITECTFGMPEYVFPKIDDIVKRVNEIISDSYSRGKPVILLGYELGKAQILSYLFSHWAPYYHDSVKKVNDVYRKFGVDLHDSIGHSEAESSGLLNKKPWLMIAPNLSGKNAFVQHMKSKYDAITVGFSGWAQSPRFAFARQHDYSIPLSDHCDYTELLQLVKDCNPEKIYTVHGFVEEFASDLVKLGYDAQPLSENALDDYF